MSYDLPSLAETHVSREWDMEQRCFNERNIKKVLDRAEGKGRIRRGESPLMVMLGNLTY